MKRRKIAIIVTSALIVLLIPAIIFAYIASTTDVYVDTDGTKYLIRYKGGVYSMYTYDGEKLEIDGEFGYYVTEAGTLIELDSETGVYEIAAVLDTEDNEDVTANSRLLIFPHTEKDDIRSLTVYNDTGSFTFHRYNILTDKTDDSVDFTIKGAPFVTCDPETFSDLYVAAGYTISTHKIKDPIKDANGEFTEYGLASETRVNEDGEEYEYNPAYYVLTDMDGVKHKLIVGDMLVTGGGYYVQYVHIDGKTETKRDAVYVIGPDYIKSVFEPVEHFATPLVTYPLTINTYSTVKNAVLLQRDDSDESGYKTVVGFSYVDMDERENTLNHYTAYKFISSNMDGYIPSGDNIPAMMNCLYKPSYVGVTKLMPTDEDFLKYGLAEEVTNDKGEKSIEFISEYVFSYEYEIPEDEETNSPSTKIRPYLMISKKNENGNYYVYTEIYNAESEEGELLYSYNMIVEVEGHSFDFLEWNKLKWIDDNYFSMNIAFCEKLTIESPKYSASFELDNSASSQDKGPNSDKLVVDATDSDGHDISTFPGFSFPDTEGRIWTITESQITCISSTGKELTITDAYYAYNKIGTQVRVVPGAITAQSGAVVKVTADRVIITSPDGDETSYIRYGTGHFRKYYTTFIVATFENVYEMTPEEESALINDPNALLLTVKMTNIEGKETVYKFYSIPGSSRKAYVTINGNGGFYVLTNRVNKIITDAQKFFADEIIDPDAKR